MMDNFYTAWENQIDQSFKEHAACRGLDPDMFMPGVGEPGKEARALCNGTPQTHKNPGRPPCPVKQECLEYALQLPGPVVGIWGGTTERDRRLLKRDLIRGVNTISTKPVVINVKRPVRHGTEAGYENHRRKGEAPCKACKEAHSQAALGWRNRDNDRITMPALHNLVRLVHEANARPAKRG